jgi:hypothetical protein
MLVVGFTSVPISLTCPLCPQLGSALHILSGCQHTQIRSLSDNLAMQHDLHAQKSNRLAKKGGVDS